MRTALMVLLALALTHSLPAAAQQPPRGTQGGPGMGMGGMGGHGAGGPGTDQRGAPQGMMNQYGYRGVDRNGDGLVSRQEVRAHRRTLERVEANWDKADRNGDGNVDAAEFAAFQQSLQAE